MKNVWLNIELSDYENHMALPNVAQAQYLSHNFGKVLKDYPSKTVALFGCAGGNGLEKIDRANTDKIVCVDINPNFVKIAERRFKDSFNNIEFVCKDVASPDFEISKVDLVYCALIFEYVNIEPAINNITKVLQREGILAVILQQLNESVAEVTPSQYKSLEQLKGLFRFVSVEKFIEICKEHRLKLISQRETELATGKKFTELILRRQ